MADTKRPADGGALKNNAREQAAPAQLADMKAFALKLKSNPKEARSFFKVAGILGEDGKLVAAFSEGR